MHESITSHHQRVQRAFESVLTLADTQQPQSLVAFERALWTAILGLGRALVALFLARQAARLRPAHYQHEGVDYVLDVDKGRTTEVGTRFGKVPFTRPVGRRKGWRARCAADLPVDRELGLCGGFSLETVTSMVYLCSMLAFATARRTFESFCEWAPSSRAVLRMVDTVGAQARPFIEATPPPEDDGEILVIQVDGRGAPMIGKTEHERRTKKRGSKDGTTQRHRRRARRRAHPRKRRASGEKSKNAKVAVLGVIYTLRRTPDGLEGPLNKRIIGTFEGHDALFRWLLHEATKRGYGTKRTLFLADGCKHIWRGQKKYFPKAEVCIDWIHVVEKLWDIAECMLDKKTAVAGDRAAWVARQTALLREGRADLVLESMQTKLAAIPKTGPGNRSKRERLAKVIGYFTRNLHRMRYDILRAADLDIATGAAEGAVRNIVGMRIDGPGMRWGRDRAELILHLRCILASDMWPAFRQHLVTLSLTLDPNPFPTRTHDAEPRNPSALAV